MKHYSRHDVDIIHQPSPWPYVAVIIAMSGLLSLLLAAFIA